MAYYDQFWMRFATQSYVTEWQKLEVGIPMGSTISPILFVLVMELLIRAVSGHGKEMELAPGQRLPAMFAFMDDLTVVQQSADAAVEVLGRLERLMRWARMGFKARKSRSVVVR